MPHKRLVVPVGGFLLSLLIVLAVWFAGPGPGRSEAVARAQAPQTAAPQPASPAASAARLTIEVPNELAMLSVEGRLIPGAGTSRIVDTPPLTPGQTYRYTISVEWQPNTYTTMTRNKTVTFRPGEAVAVDLTQHDPSDRVRVIYVPTPDDIAVEMVKLAGVTPNDVVYEPGCGDARITIAAIKAGARRGVCVDIDPARVAESRTKVEVAGFADKIDVRLGDALEMKDWSEATVVLLYMGDHFNLLIRPVLWRDLKPGARIVSHRFRMGDWEPDKTVWVTSVEGGDYELHRWDITPEVKRRSR